MIVELLLFMLFGCLLGIFTGLTPGIHVNTAAAILLALGAALDPYYLAVAIIAMAISHTFWDFVPSIILGAPEPSTALSVLPGHKLLLEGRGLEAIYLTIIGGVGVIALGLLLFPLMVLAIPLLYQNIQNYINLILVAIALVMLLSEQGMKKKAYAVFVFMLSGILGVITLDSSILPEDLLLLPLFTGMFGLSSLLLSLNRKTKIPKQNMKIPNVGRRLAFSGIIKGFFSGALVGTLPAVGAAQATVLSQQITRKHDEEEFLVSVGAINTIVALFSLVSLYTISKARSGAAVAVQSLLPEFGMNELVLLLAVALLSSGISAILMLKSVKHIVFAFQKINYSKVTIAVIGFVIFITLLMTGLTGLLILALSTAIGLLAPLFGVKRSLNMGVLMLPLIIFYTGLSL